MLDIRKILDLPSDHPEVKKFKQEMIAELEMFRDTPVGNPLDDEESQAHFDRYIAGDR